MLSPFQEVPKMLGLNSLERAQFESKVGLMTIDPMRAHVHHLTQHPTNHPARCAEQNLALHAQCPQCGWELEDPEGDAGDLRSLQDEHTPEDSTDNAAPRRPFKTRDPQSPPSPIQKNPSPSGWLPRTPSFSEQNRALHGRETVRLANGDRLLLNVTADEMKQRRTARA